MQFVHAPISTICVGQAASAAAVLLAAGAPGRRLALPNARVLIHQPHGGMQGQSSDMERALAEVVEMRRRMVQIFMDRTGKSEADIMADIDRDTILRGDAAVEYGLIDAVIERRLLPPIVAAA